MAIKVKLGILAVFGVLLLLLGAPVTSHSGASWFSLPLRAGRTAFAQSEEPPVPGAVILSEADDRYMVGTYLEILEDPEGTLTIEAVSSPEFDPRFIPSRVEVPNYGFTGSVYWVRLSLENAASLTDQWLLVVNFPNIQYVDLFTPLPQGTGFAVSQTGALRPVSDRDVVYPRFVFELPVPPQTQQTVYLRFQSGDSMTLDLSVWEPRAFFLWAQWDQMHHWLFFGAIFALLAYHLFLLTTLREASYLYFVIMLAFMLVTVATYTGYLEIYLFPGLYAYKQFYFPVVLASVFGFIVLFSDAFLELKTRFPRFHRFTMALVYGYGGLILATPLIEYHLQISLISALTVFALGVVSSAGLLAWWQRVSPARFFMIAWFGMVVSLVVIILVRFGVFPSTPLSEIAYLPGLAWMAVCWSIALADRIQLLESEKEQAGLAVQASEARYRTLVETMNDGLGVIDEQGRFTYVNKRLAEMLGYAREEMIGRPVLEFTAPDQQQILLEQFERRKSGVTTPYDLTYRKRDGSAVFVLVSPIALRDESGRYQGAFAVMTDITERVLAGRLLEQRVEERTHELAALLEISREGSTTRDLTSVLRRIMEQLHKVVDYDGFIIFTEQQEQWSSLVQVWPGLPAEIGPLELPAEEVQSVAHAFWGQELVQVLKSDLEAKNGNALVALAARLAYPGLQSVLGVPLMEKGQVTGALVLGCVEAVTEDQARVVLASANQAAIVIENNRLYLKMRTAAMAEERNRLARELHDSVTQTMFAASVLAEATPRIWGKDQGLAMRNMEKLNLLIRSALAELRSMLVEMRAEELRSQSLKQLLSTLAEAARGRTKVRFSVSVSDIPELPESVTLAFYRVAREALNNVLIHASATRVDLAFFEEQNWVELRVQDNGQGFHPDMIEAGHLGVRIMQERAEEVGAVLEIESAPGHGTVLRMRWAHQEDETRDDAKLTQNQGVGGG